MQKGTGMRLRWKACLAAAIAFVITLLTIWRIETAQLPAALLLSWTLLALTWIDIGYLLLPDRLTIPLLWAGLLSNVAGLLPRLPLPEAVCGAAAGYLSLYLLSRLYRILAGKEGLGLGDAKLLAASGAWTGLLSLPLLMLLASCICLTAMLLTHLITDRALNKPFPFGPALALASWMLFLWRHG